LPQHTHISATFTGGERIYANIAIGYHTLNATLFIFFTPPAMRPQTDSHGHRFELSPTRWQVTAELSRRYYLRHIMIYILILYSPSGIDADIFSHISLHGDDRL
jgi:hypothetical protein